MSSSTFVPDEVSLRFEPPRRHSSRIWRDVVSGLLAHRGTSVFRSGLAQAMQFNAMQCNAMQCNAMQ